MLLDLLLFEKTFPTYGDYRVPMWSKWKEDDSLCTVEVAIPGFSKSDFSLYVEDDTLYLNIKREKGDLHYSILEKYFSKKYVLDATSAKYKNGVLTIEIPKEKVKRVDIKVS